MYTNIQAMTIIKNFYQHNFAIGNNNGDWVWYYIPLSQHRLMNASFIGIVQKFVPIQTTLTFSRNMV